MTTPFKAFTRYTLTFKGLGPDVEDSETGNVVSGETVEITVEAYLKPSRDPAILRLVGDDATVTPLSGRLTDPMQFPTGLHAGMTCPLEINGVTGKFTLGPVWPAVLSVIEAKLGARIVGTWKAE